MNKDESAFPVVRDGHYTQKGMTKREYFAAKAMQGLLSIYENGQVVPNSENVAYMAKLSVVAADELIKSLENEQR